MAPSSSTGVAPVELADSHGSSKGWHELATPTEETDEATPLAKGSLAFAASYVGKHPAYLLDALTSNAEVDARLRALLTSDYEDWRAGFEVASQVERIGGLLVAQGCMAHACAGIRLSMLVLDTDRNVISVGLVIDGQGSSRSENGQIPAPLRDWLAKESAH